MPASAVGMLRARPANGRMERQSPKETNPVWI